MIFRMQFSKREKNLVYGALIVALAFAGTTVLPAVQSIYSDRERNIETVLLDIEREQRLLENSSTWRERRIEAELRAAQLEQQIFSGETIPLVEAELQSFLSRYARESSIIVGSTRLAERLETNEWLMISQEMSFRTDSANNTIGFLERLDDSIPRLYVKDFSINRTRSQYTGEITVVGFARAEGLTSEEESQR